MSIIDIKISTSLILKLEWLKMWSLNSGGSRIFKRGFLKVGIAE